jgi:virginiamycin B lyase
MVFGFLTRWKLTSASHRLHDGSPPHRRGHYGRFRPQVESLEQRALFAVSITEYALPTAQSGAIDIAAGPDGNLWVAEQSAHQVARVAPSGSITEYATSGDPVDLWAGPDNAVWFSEFSANLVGKIDTTTDQVTEYSVPTSNAGPNGMTLGADGAMWFAESLAGKIGRITSSGTITEFAVGGQPTDLALGSDGNVWFTSYGSNQVGKITPDGVATLYDAPTGAGPAGIAAGADGNLWVTEYDAGKVAQVTTSGTFTEYTLPSTGSHPWAINAGPGAALWFAESGTSEVGRITSGGQVTEYATPTPNSSPRGIVAAGDGSVWWTEFDGNQVGKMVPESPPTVTLSVTYLSGRTVTLSGQVVDDNPGSLTVTFSGTVVGTVVTNADGTFSGTFEATALGDLQASTTDGQGLVSNPATITLTSNPPQISDFTGGSDVARVWTFEGKVNDESPAGLIIHFGGIPSLENKTTTVQADGTFEFTVTLAPGERGTATATTTDWWGLNSNEAIWIVAA